MKRPLWLDLLLIVLVPILGMALGVGATFLFGINQTDYRSNLVVNLFFLAACIGFIRAYKFSREDLGLKVVKEQMRWHVIISLVIFGLYMLFYIFVIQISNLKPFSANTTWGLLTYFVVVFAEELYFRGVLYGFLEKRFSARIALIVTSILFGLLHGRQGLSGILSKTFTGWLWGSVRYSSRMIFLLIFPIHFAYNVIWLLFDGNWNNSPAWVIYGVPAIEFLFGLVIVIMHDRRSPAETQP
jgi:membrane protease YdiL (CAAX protease family)